ncbi:MAG: hypothetical protein AB1716_01415 [Planctomycetota bacterium]
MSTRASLRRVSRHIPKAVGLLPVVMLCATAWAAGPPRVISVTRADDGDQMIFALEIERPSDMAEMSIEGQRFFIMRSGWPQLARLESRPAWRYPCYLEYDPPESSWSGVEEQDPLVFVGRGPRTDNLELTIRYPGEDNAAHESVLRIDLTGAGAMKADPAPRRRWARAQAEHFRVHGEATRDTGGFYAFARRQTERRFDLIEPEQAEEEEEEDEDQRARFEARARPRRNAQEELYNITTGALAVQESLQLDRMLAPDRDAGERTVPITEIPGVTVRSHPFDRMRGDAQPVHGDLARLAPADFYFLRFASIAKLLELLDFADQWGGSLMRLAQAEGTEYGVRARLQQQLCLPATLLARVLGPAVVSEVALVGSDPYLQEGSDVSVLFKVSQKTAFSTAVGLYLEDARQRFPAAVADTVAHTGVSIERLRDPERHVSCHRCWLDDVCVYSNSLPALQRIIDTHAGRAPRLAEAPDFRYMRAVVFPLDPEKEDGFLFLSDPFIRRLEGPEVRIAEKRRLEAITSLKLLTNAALLYGYEHGPARPTFEQLTATGVLDPNHLFDPEGGQFTWDAERGLAHSGIWGDLRFLTPLIEVPCDHATAKEKAGYDDFRARYEEYWREYFDPIGVRLQVGRTVRMETCILPLIDNSEYERFEDLTGGEPIDVRPDLFTPGTLLRVIMRLNEGTTKGEMLAFLNAATHTNAASDWLGDWVTFWLEDSASLAKLAEDVYAQSDAPERRPSSSTLDIFNSVLVGGVHVKNKLSLAAFLVAIRTFVEQSAPDMVVFSNLPPYHGVTIVRVAPHPEGPLAAELEAMEAADSDEESDDESAPLAPAPQTESAPPAAAPETQPAQGAEPAPNAAPAERGPAICYATIGDGFYISTQASALRALIDRRIAATQPAATRPGASQPPTTLRAAARAAATQPAAAPAGLRQKANIFVYIAPGAADRSRPAVSYVLEQQAREAAIRNMAHVWLLGRCGVLADRKLDEAARLYLGYGLKDADGGTYTYDPERNEVTSPLHGPLSAPVRLTALPDGSPLKRLLESLDSVSGSLRFTKEGVNTRVDIERE